MLLDNIFSQGFISAFDQGTVITFVLVFTVCILLQRLFYHESSAYNQPPSPKGWVPIIGHLHLIEPDLRVLFKRYRQELGDIFQLQLGCKIVIVVNGYNVIKDVLVTQGDRFIDRPSLLQTDKITRCSGISNSSGQKWRELRRFTLSTLKDLGMGKSSLEVTIHDEIKGLLDVIEATKCEPFDPRNFLLTSIGNVICSMVFGSTFKHGDETMHRLEKIFAENAQNVGVSGVVNFLPFLAYLPGDLFKYKKLLRNTDVMFTTVERILGELQQAFEDDNIVNFSTAFFEEMEKAVGTERSSTFNMKELSSLALDLFAAGTETLTGTIRWALAILATRPDIQERLFIEIRDNIGTDRLLGVDDKPKMAYLEAFYMEVLRYGNVAAIGLLRTTKEDIVLHDFLIKKDSVILVNYDSICMDNLWGDPYNFRPERFLDETGKLMKTDKFVAFSLGKRNCVGESLAKMELLLFLGALVQRFEFHCPPGQDLSLQAIDGEHGFIHCPKPYSLIAKPR